MYMERLIKTWQDVISKLASYFIPKQIILTVKRKFQCASVDIIVAVHSIIEFRYVRTWT